MFFQVRSEILDTEADFQVIQTSFHLVIYPFYPVIQVKTGLQPGLLSFLPGHPGKDRQSYPTRLFILIFIIQLKTELFGHSSFLPGHKGKDFGSPTGHLSFLPGHKGKDIGSPAGHLLFHTRSIRMKWCKAPPNICYIHSHIFHISKIEIETSINRPIVD